MACSTWRVAGAQTEPEDAPAEPQAEAAAEAPSEAEVESRRHFEMGSHAFDTGDYELAITEFRRAYELFPHPGLLYNIYAAAERTGRLEEAATALEGHIRDGAELDESRRQALEQRLARLRQRIAEAQAVEETQPTDSVAIPQPAPAPEPAGAHPAAIALLVGAGALMVSFGVFAGLSEREDQALNDRCGQTCSDDEVATLRTFNVIADVSWAAGAALGVTGLVLLFALPREPQGVALTPWVGPTGAGLAWSRSL